MKKTRLIMPITLVSLSYKDIYDDYDTVDVHTILEGIPSVSVIYYVTMLQARVAYKSGNAYEQISIILEFLPYLSETIRRKINAFIKHNKYHVSLIDAHTCFYTQALALQNFVPHESDDNELDLCQDEFEPVFKAILYCNQRWTEDQMDGISDKSDLTEISLRIDLPIVEFKHHKDVLPQLFKAVQFFRFAESDPYYKTLLPFFYADNGVEDWESYLSQICSFYISSLKNPIVKIETKDFLALQFFDHFLVDIADCEDLWSGRNSINYLRDHFLLKLSWDTFLLLNPNLLVDKIFQGLKFAFAETIQKHSLSNKKGEPYDVKHLKTDFLSQLGTDFSEPHLMYSLLQKIFAVQATQLFTGEFMKSEKIPDEPDFYLRIGEILYLIEYKDSSLGDSIRYSHDYKKKIRPEICNRICKYSGKKSKGFGQILNSIDNIFSKRVMDTLDPDVQKVKTVVPIILTTDRAFSSLGVQRILIEESDQIMKDFHVNSSICITQPIVVDFDTLVICGSKLHKGVLKLDMMIHQYFQRNKLFLSPFNTFVIDNCLKKSKITKGDIHFITEGFVELPN